MIWTENWLIAVLQLFDDTIRALLGEAYFSAILQFMVLFMVIGLLSSMLRAGKKV